MGGRGVTAVMVVVECLEVGLSTLSKAAMRRGMSNLVYIVYSNALAIFFLLPASLFFYSSKKKSQSQSQSQGSLPQLTCSIIFRIFILVQLCCSVQIFMNYGIWYSSPTLSSAMIDLTPAFTFLLAIFSRMERLDTRAKSCWAKSIGTIVSITGALTVSLYKGLPIINSLFQDTNYNSTTNNNLLNLNIHELNHPISSAEQQPNWAFGGILLAAGALSLSLLYIVQTWIMRDYPEELMVTLLSCILVTIQSTVVAFIAEKDPNAWILKPDVELITIIYSAFFGAAIRSVVHTWACRKKGPVYVSMFKPLGMVVALIMGVSFLGDTLYLGSLIGAAIIAIGFYSVIWGQAQEEKKVVAIDTRNKICSLDEESSPQVPLLKSKNMET